MERHCRNCLRRCQKESHYLQNLDYNGNKIDFNCWFEEEELKTSGNYAKKCDDYINVFDNAIGYNPTLLDNLVIKESE